MSPFEPECSNCGIYGLQAPSIVPEIAWCCTTSTHEAKSVVECVDHYSIAFHADVVVVRNGCI